VCVTLAGGSLIYYRMRSKISAHLFTVFSLLIIIADIGLFTLRLTFTMTPLDTMQSPPYVAVFSKEPTPYRILPLNAMMFINQGSRFSIPAVTGYNSLILSSYLELLGAIRETPVDPADRVPMVETYKSPLLKMLNVKYVLSYQPLADPHLDLLHSSDIYVYKVKQIGIEHTFMVYRAEYFDNTKQIAAYMAQPSFNPMQSVIFEDGLQQTVPLTKQIELRPESQVSILNTTLNSIAIEAYTNTAGWLVVSEVYYPGWKAYVDGQEVAINKANLSLRAIEMKPGHHYVEFVYDPDSVRYGLLITFVGVILVVSLLMLSFILDRKEAMR